jgi:uncharacterized heparinase superfamily protein
LENFVIAERARITRLVESENSIQGEHDGYKNMGFVHQRTFHRAEKQLTIEDTLTGNTQKSACAYLHFHPSIQALMVEDHKLILSDLNVKIEFNEGIVSIEKITYKYCTGFNQTEKAIAFKIVFQQHLKTTITL